jgi:molybdate transport system substrate-binding protein
MPTAALTAISSMATRALLAELLPACEAATGCRLTVESVGGVDAAKRVRAGEAFDLVILAADALEKLRGEGWVGPPRALVDSGISAAVREGSPRPDVSTLPALAAALRASRGIGVSTGPSGVQLLARLEAWGLMPELREKLVQPPPGTPVGTLLAQSEIDIAFQQTAELIHLPGLALLEPLATEAQILTTFGAAIGRGCRDVHASARVLDHFASPACDAAKRRHGFEPAAEAHETRP